MSTPVAVERLSSLAGQCVCGAVERMSLHMLVGVCVWGGGAVERLSSHAGQCVCMGGGGGAVERLSSCAGQCVWGAVERLSLHMLINDVASLPILASVRRPQCSTGHHAAALGLPTNTPQTQLCCLQK